VSPTVEFAYDSPINRVTEMSPFEIVHGYQPRQFLDLISMTPHHISMSESAASFASHIHDLHKEINIQIQKATQTTKLIQTCTRRHKNLM